MKTCFGRREKKKEEEKIFLEGGERQARAE